MAQPYLDDLKDLIGRAFAGVPDLDCKHFFAGAALYARGSICATLTPIGLAVKMPQQRCVELLVSSQAEPLRYFENAPVKKGYVLFTSPERLDAEMMTNYLLESLEHVLNQSG